MYVSKQLWQVNLKAGINFLTRIKHRQQEHKHYIRNINLLAIRNFNKWPIGSADSTAR